MIPMISFLLAACFILSNYATAEDVDQVTHWQHAYKKIDIPEFLESELLFDLEGTQRKMAYNETLVELIKDEDIWNIKEQMDKLPLPQQNLFLITEEFYDEYIVSRWTNEWLAEDEIWVIGFTDDTSINKYYRPGLVARTVHILAKHYRNLNGLRKAQVEIGDSLDHLKFGLVNIRRETLLAQTFFDESDPPFTVVMRDGIVLRDGPMLDTYDHVNDFIEKVNVKNDIDTSNFYSNFTVSGRLTTYGYYKTIWYSRLTQEQRNFGQWFQRMLDRHSHPIIREFIFEYYTTQDVGVQIIENLIFTAVVMITYIWILKVLLSRLIGPNNEENKEKQI